MNAHFDATCASGLRSVFGADETRNQIESEKDEIITQRTHSTRRNDKLSTLTRVEGLAAWLNPRGWGNVQGRNDSLAVAAISETGANAAYADELVDWVKGIECSACYANSVFIKPRQAIALCELKRRRSDQRSTGR
jgi:hypothetical protein